MTERAFTYTILIVLFVLEMLLALFIWVTASEIRDLTSRVEEVENINELQSQLEEELVRGIQAQVELNKEITKRLK